MGIFIQSTSGNAGNFEVAVPRVGGGADFWWRDNDHPALPWHGPILGFGGPEDVGGIGLIQSTFYGHLEVVLREGSQLVSTWRDGNGRWQGRTLLPGSAAPVGSPAFIQGRLGGAVGNFEVVAPLSGGGFGHWYRSNNVGGLPWSGPTGFGSGQASGVALVHSSYGNLEIVACVGGQLVHYWRGGNTWNGPNLIASGVTGEPDLIQASNGNFEVVAPLAAGGVGHWWRDNNSTSMAWHGPTAFGAGQPAGVGLVQSKAGKLCVVARFADHLEYWQRDDGGTWAWQGPTTFGADPYTDASVYGTSTIPYHSGIVGIHAALLHTGKVVLFGYGDTDDGHGVSRVLDPVTGALTTPPESHELFCGGHAFLEDGRLVVAGGHHGEVKGVHVFDPTSGKWSHVADMPNGRWYPTVTALPNGEVLTISGTKNGGPTDGGNPVNNSLQILLSGAGVEEALPSPFSSHFPANFPTVDLYPFVYVLPSGKLLVHSRNVTRFYDPATHSWDATQLVATYPFSRTYPGEGSSALLPLLPAANYRARVLVLGGGGTHPDQLTTDTPATNTAELLDLGAQPLGWQSLPSMAYPRVMPDATILPDGTVLVNGGSSTGRADFGIDPVLPYELFDPVTLTWRTLRTAHVPRVYHSSAVLLPDATVMMLGKDGVYNPDPYKYPEHRAEIYMPPYLFRGPRPVIQSAPGSVTLGDQFTVDFSGSDVDRVHLVRPSSTTHSFNMEQRLVGLQIVARSGSTLTLEAPPDAAVAVPGYWMLFLLNAAGAPSHAHFLKLQT